MSTGHPRQRSNSNKGSSIRSEIKIKPPTPSATPGADEFAFDPVSATASFLLVAQRNEILCLHHDTLALERRFTRHREDVSWIHADTVSERGGGRLVVSYDAGSTAIVWDLLTGDEVARFASYEQIRVAAWMRNGNVAFGESRDSGCACPFHQLTRGKETPRAVSSSSNHPHLSTSLQGLFSTPLLH
jgi:WD40 repeat protein